MTYQPVSILGTYGIEWWFMIKFTLTLPQHINLSKIVNIKKIQSHFSNNHVDIIQYFNQKFLF